VADFRGSFFLWKPARQANIRGMNQGKIKKQTGFADASIKA